MSNQLIRKYKIWHNLCNPSFEECLLKQHPKFTGTPQIIHNRRCQMPNRKIHLGGQAAKGKKRKSKKAKKI